MAKHRLINEPQCPKCRAKLDGASGIDYEDRPEDGDVSVCVYCYALLVYTPELDLRQLTLDEYTALSEDVKDTLANAQAMLKMLNDARGRGGKTLH